MGETQKKGNIGLVETIANLTRNGISVSIPISESEKYDLIGEKNGICKTIQVKFAKIHKDSIPVNLRSIWTNGNGYQIKHRKKQDFDILAVYCPDMNCVYYIDKKEFKNKNAITFRVKEPERNRSRCRMIYDYLDCKKLW